MKKLIYICSPLRGNIKKNIKKAIEYSRYVFLQGHIPYAPHTIFTQFLDDKIESERTIAMEMGNIMLLKCDEIWVFGDIISDGMASEIELAGKNKILIRTIRNIKENNEKLGEIDEI